MPEPESVEEPEEEVVEEVYEEDVYEEDEDDFYRGERRGFFSRLWVSIRGRDKDGYDVEEVYEEEVYEEDDEVDVEQVKEFLRELHPWLESFEPRTMKRFKKSSAFRKYKELLEELEMIQNE